ncbi:hypothetical protein BV898_10718 [Hypsibius exemplaris]|uniref:Uncharacterized protein n=1 Tax=Hypsibius exemplaris TaxID=2072580 RepID=A0A1W0WIS3_HYPEX|nr:hypothetical protein BV898_10718 [Hypsibius exemplaris]
MNTETSVAHPVGAITGSSSWSLTKSHTFNFSEFIRTHSMADFKTVASASPDDLESFADSETAFELTKGSEEDDNCCALSVSADDGASIVGVVIICDCAIMELYGPANCGYICTSRGTIIVEDEDMNLYGHLVDLRISPVAQIALRVFSKSKSTPISITFLGFHVYTKAVSLPATFNRDSGDVLRGLFSTASSSSASPAVSLFGNSSSVPLELLCQKVDHLRADMTAMECLESLKPKRGSVDVSSNLEAEDERTSDG